MVEAYDVRDAAKEEVKSLGARFVEFDLDTGQEGGGSGAYATALTDEQLAKQRELMTQVVAEADVVITTAQVQGAKAPVLITDEMVKAMAPGSVVVDLAAEQGGNVRAQPRRRDRGRRAACRSSGRSTCPRQAPHHASLMYAKNVANFLALIIADGAVAPNPDDDIVNQSTVARERRAS